MKEIPGYEIVDEIERNSCIGCSIREKEYSVCTDMHQCENAKKIYKKLPEPKPQYNIKKHEVPDWVKDLKWGESIECRVSSIKKRSICGYIPGEDYPYIDTDLCVYKNAEPVTRWMPKEGEVEMNYCPNCGQKKEDQDIVDKIYKLIDMDQDK